MKRSISLLLVKGNRYEEALGELKEVEVVLLLMVGSGENALRRE